LTKRSVLTERSDLTPLTQRSDLTPSPNTATPPTLCQNVKRVDYLFSNNGKDPNASGLG